MFLCYMCWSMHVWILCVPSTGCIRFTPRNDPQISTSSPFYSTQHYRWHTGLFPAACYDPCNSSKCDLDAIKMGASIPKSRGRNLTLQAYLKGEYTQELILKLRASCPTSQCVRREMLSFLFFLCSLSFWCTIASRLDWKCCETQNEECVTRIGRNAPPRRLFFVFQKSAK